MKKCLLMLMAVMLALTMQAQVKAIVLGDKHVMLKVKSEAGKYLLLPVQESEDIAAIAMLDIGSIIKESSLL